MPMHSQSYTRNCLLSALSADDFALLQPHLKRVVMTHGEVLIVPDRPIRHAWFVESGIGSVVTSHEGGDEIEVGLFGFEGMCGVAAVLQAEAMPGKAMIQVDDATALRIDTAALLEACRTSETLQTLLLRYAQTTIVQCAQTAAANAHYALPERLARWLLMCHDRVQGDELALTHEFLSIMLAVRRSGVTVTLHTLEGAGAIRSRRGLVTVTNRRRLEEIAGDAYGLPEQEYRRLIGPFGRSGENGGGDGK